MWLKNLYLYVFRLLPVHFSYSINRVLRSPYSAIEYNNNIIYIHIPKAAGNALMKTLYGSPATGHDTLLRYFKKDSKQFNKSFKFAVVRNPFDRMVSSFFYLKQGGIGFFDIDFSNQYLIGLATFNDFIRKIDNDPVFRDKIMTWVHFVPQLDFLTLDGKDICVDKLIKLETIGLQLPALCRELGLPVVDMQHDNSSKRGSYKDYYSDETAAIVAKLYSNDLEQLKYEFGE
jgi:chondroitin 4-sulfotransferase 11